jgi:hypothetical protein
MQFSKRDGGRTEPSNVPWGDYILVSISKALDGLIIPYYEDLTDTAKRREKSSKTEKLLWPFNY